MAGYISVTGQFTVDASTMGGEMITLDPYKAFAFLVVEKGVMIGGELDGATVDFTDGTNSYSAMSVGGFADFSDVLYGTYDYTVSLDGYTTVTGQFTVDASTNGGPMIEMEPIPTTVGDVSVNSIKLYPNPAIDFINVELGAVETTVVISVINSNGAIVSQIESVENTTRLDVNELASGVYFINVSGEGISQTIKFVKK
uniref:T9SS type A sorting domain-containing protein n=1 Tax=Carboxylicivirga fragile TaxID=3417571 RepID=UPI003D34A02D|nr:T9SS type A sorting domain-containing protein [Marinilabiliaceae bacterium N1Y90]